MHKRISVVALGLLAIVYGSNLLAQGTSRLQVRVTVVPVVTATALPDARMTAAAAQDAQFIWNKKQPSHIITRNANVAEFGDAWLNSSNPCQSQGTKVPHRSSDAAFCEITINTVVFVTE